MYFSSRRSFLRYCQSTSSSSISPASSLEQEPFSTISPASPSSIWPASLSMGHMGKLPLVCYSPCHVDGYCTNVDKSSESAQRRRFISCLNGAGHDWQWTYNSTALFIQNFWWLKKGLIPRTFESS